VSGRQLLIRQGIEFAGDHPQRDVGVNFPQPLDRLRFPIPEHDDGFEISKGGNSPTVMREEADATVVVLAKSAAGAEEIDVAMIHPLVAKFFHPRRRLASGGVDDE
jgi:hypothetical protein